jgi:formamidopyrimidine-DNA glycosylase
MPEMPEVETMVRDLAPHVVGRTISAVEAPFPGSIVWPSLDEFRIRVRNHTITDVTRRGKYASFQLASGDALIVHRGMTGALLLRRPEQPREPHVRVIFLLDNELELRFDDPRKFGRVYVMEAHGSEQPLPWAKLGPEPLSHDFTAAALARNLRERKALLKPLLLSQSIVAGLGNIYVDEVLFRARIHPLRRANSLKQAEMKRLHAAIQDVLSAAIDGRGTTFRSYVDIDGRQGTFQESLLVFHRAGAACPRCLKGIIERIVVGGRGTHVCPRCQRI